MDKGKQPGIVFENVFLISLHFELPKLKQDEKNVKYDIKFDKVQNIQDNKLIVELFIEIYEGFNLKIGGIFRIDEPNKNMTLEKFAETSAPALLFPYIREIVNNITSRTPLPPLRLPPINVIALLKKESK